MSYPRKTLQIQQAKRLKARYQGLPITKIAKIVGVHSSTLYNSDWYQTIKPVRGYAGASRQEQVEKKDISRPVEQPILLVPNTPSLKSARPIVPRTSQDIGELAELLGLVTEVQVKLLDKLTAAMEAVSSLYKQS